MKTKGFTLIELVVACTLLVMLSTIATTSTYNFLQAVTSLKTQFQNVRNNIIPLYGLLTKAQLQYTTKLAFALAAPTDPTAVQNEIWDWNNKIDQNLSPALVTLLINNGLLPPTRSVQVTTYNNGNPTVTTVYVPITDLDSLLRAFQLTDDGTSTGTPVATITFGKMLDVKKNTSPTPLTIDWKPGTAQEIVLPPSA
jgi:prepilin-type N-terminal cleavage/methylation domain-containing protein